MRRLAQEDVAGGVAEGVVDVLEGVEIDEQHRDAGVGAGGAGLRVSEPVDQQLAVWKPRQRIV